MKRILIVICTLTYFIICAHPAHGQLLGAMYKRLKEIRANANTYPASTTKSSNGYLYMTYRDSLNTQYVGIKDVLGTIIIPTSNQYTKINFIKEDSTYVGFYQCERQASENETMIDIRDLSGNLLFNWLDTEAGRLSFAPTTTSNGKIYFIVSRISSSFIDGEGLSMDIKKGIVDINGKLIHPITLNNDTIITYINDNEGFKSHREEVSFTGNIGTQDFKINTRIFDEKMISIGLIDSPIYEKLQNLGSYAKDISDNARRNPKVTRKVHTESNGFKWIELSKGYDYSRRLAAITEQNDTIIPFSANCYVINFTTTPNGVSYFRIENLGSSHKGIYSLDGKIIVPVQACNNISFIETHESNGIFNAFSVFPSKYSVIYDLYGNEIIPSTLGYDIHYEELENGIGYLAVSKEERYGAYDIYGNVLVPLGKEGNKLYYGELGFYFADETHYNMGLQVDKNGRADYSLRNKWEAEQRAHQKEQEKLQKRKRRLNFINQMGNLLAQTTANYLAYQQMSQYSYGYTPTPYLRPQSEVLREFTQGANQIFVQTIVDYENKLMEEFEQFRRYNKHPDGRDYTYNEWTALRGQAIQDMKDQGYDIIAEQREMNRQNKEAWRASLEADRKDRLDRIKEYNNMRTGTTSAYSSSSNSSSSNYSSSSTSSSSSYSSSISSSGTSYNSSTTSSANEQTMPEYDAKQQFKTQGVYSDDYEYKKKVTLYTRNGDNAKVVFNDKDLCKKGAYYYVKIDNKYYSVNYSNWSRFDKSILYANESLYFNL